MVMLYIKPIFLIWTKLCLFGFDAEAFLESVILQLARDYVYVDLALPRFQRDWHAAGNGQTSTSCMRPRCLFESAWIEILLFVQLLNLHRHRPR